MTPPIIAPRITLPKSTWPRPGTMKVATVAAIVRATGTGLGAAICSDNSSLYKLFSPREILVRVMNGTHRTYGTYRICKLYQPHKSYESHSYGTERPF